MKSIVALALVFALTGCVSLLPDPGPPAAIYTLRAGEVARLPGPPKPVVVAIAAPVAARSVAGTDIVWRQGASIAFMDRAAWDGAAPDLLQALLLDVADRRGGVRAVVRADAGVRADVEVRWDLLAFEVVEDGGAIEARIETAAQLVDLRAHTVVATQRFNAHAPISTRSGRAAASALEQVATEAAIQTADWAIAAAQPSAASTSR